MSLSAQELSDVIAELQPLLSGSFLNKLNAPGPDQLQLVFRAGLVLVDWTRGASRIHLIERKLPGPAQPPAWVMKARAELSGRLLAAIDQPAGDRIVRLSFSAAPARRLVIEMFGRGRLLLLDEDDLVLAALVGRAEPGSPHQPPSGGAPPQADSRFGRPEPSSLTVNRKVAEHYQRVGAERALTVAKRSRSQGLAALERRLARRIAKLQADQQRTRQAEELSRAAEALKYQLGAVRRGQTRIHLPDPYDPAAGALSVELDPRLSPQENLARMFARAKRLAAARGGIGQRLTTARAELDRLRELAARVTLADSLPALERLQPEATRLGLATDPGASTRRSARPGRRLPYRAYLSANGTPILVGRSGRDNHALTFQVARGWDLWLHTRDAAGAHVIVRAERGRPVDEQTLLDAATLAAHHSPLKQAGKVEVSYTRAKDVHPIKGAAPGLVSVASAKTLLVRLEPERLARLKQSRSDPGASPS